MRVSKKRINPYLSKQLFFTLHQAVADLKTPEEVEAFFKAFLRDSEHTILAKRLAVAYWVDKKRSYKNIQQNLNVSAATISEMIDKMDLLGVRNALQKIKAEEWAAQWSEKIKKFVKVG